MGDVDHLAAEVRPSISILHCRALVAMTKTKRAMTSWAESRPHRCLPLVPFFALLLPSSPHSPLTLLLSLSLNSPALACLIQKAIHTA